MYRELSSSRASATSIHATKHLPAQMLAPLARELESSRYVLGYYQLPFVRHHVRFFKRGQRVECLRQVSNQILRIFQAHA